MRPLQFVVGGNAVLGEDVFYYVGKRTTLHVGHEETAEAEDGPHPGANGIVIRIVRKEDLHRPQHDRRRIAAKQIGPPGRRRASGSGPRQHERAVEPIRYPPIARTSPSSTTET
jgi:hypothetical protein